MTMFHWAIFLGLMVAGTGLGLLAFVLATSPRFAAWARHHDHLLPRTPDRFRPARG